ncbi:hypothetical protein V2J09_004725 [Rumex salicifolius]
MKKTFSLPSLQMNDRFGNGFRKSDDRGDDVVFLTPNNGEIEDDFTDQVSCMTIHSNKRQNLKLGEIGSTGKQSLWRKQQRTRAARLEKQLRAKWELEELIEEQLAHFNAQYNQANSVILLKDVPQLLMPDWASPLEMTSLGWMGDWRPSSILELLRTLARLTTFSFSASSQEELNMERTVSRLIKEIRIEETILDEEMGEIHSTCILNLPFGQANPSGGSALEKVMSEFKKIERVVSKAQKLRYKVLELIVKKVLNQTDAAEFLVMFAAIQDTIHQFCAHHKSQKVPVSLPTKHLEGDTIWEPSIDSILRFSNLAGKRNIHFRTR